MLKKAKLYYDTIKWLRWEQIVYRIYYRFAKPKVKCVERYTETNTHLWIWTGPEFLKPSLLSSTEAIFLNERGLLRTKSDWNNPKKEKLWLYNLHYFDDLNAQRSQERNITHKEVMQRWIIQNPPPAGNGWEPYPTSLRIVNWVKWLSRQEDKDEQRHKSLLQQVDILDQQLEYHILGNHLFANAKALIFLGAYFDTKSSKQYLKKGLFILNEQINEQFLCDGGHFERSPMYHSILLNDLLELICLAKISRNPTIQAHEAYWCATARKALDFLTGMLHPDNEISFFNDAAFGIAPSPSHLFSFAEKLGLALSNNEQRLLTFKESGYSRIQNEHNVVLFDHGVVGPDYLPGHAHADTLSFEWSHLGQRIVVNSGTSLYGGCQERLRQRQTPAHSTITVNNLSSSQVWSGFRVAKRASGELISAKEIDSRLEVRARHDGYMVLGQKVMHYRTITLNENFLSVTDTIEGNPNCAEAFFHLHPTIRVNKDGNDPKTVTLIVEITKDNSSHSINKHITVRANHSIEVIKSTWHPEFGASTPNKSLRLRITQSKSNTLTFQY